MYIVIELQTNNGTTAIVPPVAYADLNVAYQKYYQALSAAAVSNVEVHAVLIVGETGNIVASSHFAHRIPQIGG